MLSMSESIYAVRRRKGGGAYFIREEGEDGPKRGAEAIGGC